MKSYLILGLLVTAACAEKKINLEDIERDNLRAESKTKIESIRTDETKYAAQPNIYQQQYQTMSQYNGLDVHAEPHVPVQQLHQVPPETYVPVNQYAVQEVQYKQPNQILPQQSLPPLQYYSEYQQQAQIPAKNLAPIAFASQRLNYQPEVVVGNHIQSVQQKVVTEKYAKPVSKEPVYIDIPMTQLLSYYPQLDINSLKIAGLARPPLMAQQIPIMSVYTPVYGQRQLLSPGTKTSYSPIVPASFTTKVTKGSAQTLPLPSKKLTTALPGVLTTPLYVQPQAESVAQGKTLLHTQAYIAQPQYVQQLVYTQPQGVVYGDPAAAYSNLYTRIPAYVQDNSLRGQPNQYHQGQSVLPDQYQNQQQLYVASTIGQEAPKEVLQEQVGQDISQTYAKQQMAEEPKAYFVPPQLPAENFKSDITQLEPVSSEDEQALPLQDHPLPSEPRSLLDTYIPSKFIAAQDSARYRERPIKLEGGFLPSKTNFALKKRKSE